MSGKSKLDGADVGSGRYPLGSGERPYQDYPSLRNRIKEKFKEYKEKRDAKREEDYNRYKKIVLERGSAEDIYKNRHAFTHQQIRDALTRLKDEEDLRNYMRRNSDINRIQPLFDNLATINRWTETGIKTYNNLAGIMNTINYEGIQNNKKKKMQFIKTSDGKGKGGGESNSNPQPQQTNQNSQPQQTNPKPQDNKNKQDKRDKNKK